MIRQYSYLIDLKTIEERFEYLKLSGKVGSDTFGYDRYLNQKFYKSKEWRDIRHHVIIRDQGCDLGILGFEISKNICIHHMNPIEIEDFTKGSPDIFDPEFLICTSFRTHQAIHYGNKSLLPKLHVKRTPKDTNLW